MSRIRNSFALARSSWAVLKADKELLLLPVISGAVSVIVAASFLVPLLTSPRTGSGSGTRAVLLFVPYFLLAYITIFFNAALISAANERLQGGDPTIRSALRGARSRAAKILPWAFLSATVSIILRLAKNKAGWRRQTLTFGGMAWTVITFLALPIIVVEGTGAVKALKKSGRLVRATWGESLAGHVGLGVVGFLLFLPAPVLAAGGAASDGTGVGAAAIAVGILWAILVVIVMSALSSIYQTVLYHFAVAGDVPSTHFDHSTMGSAFYSRKSRRRGRRRRS